MKRMKIQCVKITGLIIVCLMVSACDRNFSHPVEDENYNAGEADFSKFVSLGDSLTAGYADSALYQSGQENSYPAILAQQFAKVGGGTFTQPLMNDNLGGLLFGGAPNPEFANRLILDAMPRNPPDDLTPKGPESISGDPTTEVTSVLTGAFNNVGVPGAKSFHLLSTAYADPENLALGAANPYFVRFASTTRASMLADAVAQQPSFFILWIGNNDILSYATKGGVGVDQLGNADLTAYNANDITDPTVFANVYTGLLTAMTTNAATKGVLVNIPNVSTIPYFSTVPYNAVPLDQTTADALNAAYVAYNTGLMSALNLGTISENEAATRNISFKAGKNAVVISDEDLTDLTGSNLPSMRQATAEDLLVLTAGSKIGTLSDESNPNSAWGVSVPLEDGDVLIASEIQIIETARLAFNATIKAAADGNENLLHVDVAAIMFELSATGIDYGTGFVNANYATGGAFSLDGVHPTARGYALIANRMIEEINQGFNAKIPVVDPGEYSTIFIK